MSKDTAQEQVAYFKSQKDVIRVAVIKEQIKESMFDSMMEHGQLGVRELWKI